MVGVGLAELPAYLDREAERRRVRELETDDGMRDPGRAPVIDGEIDAGDLREMHGARLPVRRVIGLGPVVAVADVVQCDFVSVDFRPRKVRDIGLPVGLVGRRKAEPPNKHAGKEHDKDAELSPEWPNEQKHDATNTSASRAAANLLPPPKGPSNQTAPNTQAVAMRPTTAKIRPPSQQVRRFMPGQLVRCNR